MFPIWAELSWAELRALWRSNMGTSSKSPWSFEFWVSHFITAHTRGEIRRWTPWALWALWTFSFDATIHHTTMNAMSIHVHSRRHANVCMCVCICISVHTYYSSCTIYLGMHVSNHSSPASNPPRHVINTLNHLITAQLFQAMLYFTQIKCFNVKWKSNRWTPFSRRSHSKAGEASWYARFQRVDVCFSGEISKERCVCQVDHTISEGEFRRLSWIAWHDIAWHSQRTTSSLVSSD